MSVTQQQLNLNQFSLQAIVGQKAENFGLTMVKQCVVSPNQTTALVPGQAVQFDTAVTSGPIPSIIAASPSQKADGYIEYDVKNGGNLVSGVVCSVIISGALYLLADVAMDQGAVFEDAVDGNIEPFGTTAGAYPRGEVLAPAAAGQIVPVLVGSMAAKIAGAAAAA